MSHLDHRGRAEQEMILKARLESDPEFKEFRRRWRALESWERFIYQRFYGRFHRRWSLEAKACVDKVAEKLSVLH